MRSFCSVHQRLSVYLRIVSCDQKIDLDKFEKFCTSTYVLILEAFSWFEISPTLHKVLLLIFFIQNIFTIFVTDYSCC